jgi:hypothetical protein
MESPGPTSIQIGSRSGPRGGAARRLSKVNAKMAENQRKTG